MVKDLPVNQSALSQTYRADKADQYTIVVDRLKINRILLLKNFMRQPIYYPI